MSETQEYTITRDATERDQFVALVMSYSDKPYGYTARVAAELIRLASRWQYLAETECNRSLTEREQRSQDKLRDKIEACVNEIHRALIIRVHLDGDPRGNCCKLIFPNGEYNTWGGRETGYAVPVTR